MSERDIVGAAADGMDLMTVCASDLAAPTLITAGPHERIIDVAHRLLDRGVRHIAIVEGDDVVDMLSMRDLIAVLLDACSARHE